MSIPDQHTPPRSQNAFVPRPCVTILFAVTGFLSPLFAVEPVIQIDSKASYYTVKPHPYIDTGGNSEGMLFNTVISACRTITTSTQLLLDYRLRGTNHNNLFPELQLPFDNYLYAGILDYELIVIFQAGFSNEILPYAQAFSMPYYRHLFGAYYLPEMVNSVNGAWKYENTRVEISTKATMFRSTYELIPGDPYTSPSIALQPPFGRFNETDLWTDLAGSFSLNDDFGLNAGWLHKDDLTKYNGYNINRVWGGISGDHQLLKSKMQIEWHVRERLLQSAVMQGEDYATGLATDLSLKLVKRQKRNLFLKGLTRMELGQQIHKVFYQAQISKLFRDNSTLGFDYFGTTGVLFPRQGARVACMIMLSRRLGISPVLEGFMSMLPGESSMRFYRSDMKLELQYSLRPRMELYAGWNSRYYDRHPLFASRSSMYTGLNAW
jgi:hypothetical protein